jgi:TonB family protein
MRANEFVTEEPRTAAPKPEIVSVQDDGKTITIKVRGHDGTVRAISNSNPAVLQQQLNLKYGLRLPHSIAKKFAGMPAAMAEDQPDDPDSWQSQEADQRRDVETAKMSAQDAEAGGVAEAKRKKKSSRSTRGYFFPGYGYYGSSDSGDGGGDGGGESINRGMSEEGMDEDLSRRGFLKGVGAAAVAGTGLAPTNAKAIPVLPMLLSMLGSLPAPNTACAPRGIRLGQKVFFGGETQEVIQIYGESPHCKNPDFPIAIKVGKLDQTKNQQVDSDLEQKRRENMARMASANQGTTYAQKIIRRIKPNITFMDVDKMEGNPEAIVEIRCAPDGTILSRKLTKSSGNTEWDQAVIRAIDKSEQIPRDVDGKVPSPIIISFKPLDESVNQGVAKGDLNEKSTSQAQFRTMAAAAHNPKFAKKVGISPDVAREFHGADKKSNYRSLPRKAAEDASWGMAPEGRGYTR